jgi:hypothetical protein
VPLAILQYIISQEQAIWDAMVPHSQTLAWLRVNHSKTRQALQEATTLNTALQAQVAQLAGIGHNKRSLPSLHQLCAVFACLVMQALRRTTAIHSSDSLTGCKHTAR